MSADEHLNPRQFYPYVPPPQNNDVHDHMTALHGMQPNNRLSVDATPEQLMRVHKQDHVPGYETHQHHTVTHNPELKEYGLFNPKPSYDRGRSN